MAEEYRPLDQCVINDKEHGIELDFSGLANAIPQYIGAENLMVDVETIGRICDRTRISVLKVSAINQKGEEQIDIKGIGGDGTAIGSAERLPPQNELWRRCKSVLPKYSHATKGADDFAVTVGLNIAALQKRIEESDGKLNDINEWQSFIDDNLKKELWEQAKKSHKFQWRKFSLELAIPIIYPLTLIHKLSKKQLLEKFAAAIVAAVAVSFYYAFHLPGYLAIFCLSKKQLKPEITKSTEALVEERKLVVKKYDPETAFTLGDWEWDRLLATHKDLKKQLVRSKK
ncbi:hypothetical protein JKY72_05630 [Candidatus Gracilibacteria bacterium]|nr:hypothetical protein [Candidatus Gracilibacteria bacterium]